MSSLQALAEAIRNSVGLAHKRDIAVVVDRLSQATGFREETAPWNPLPVGEGRVRAEALNVSRIATPALTSDSPTQEPAAHDCLPFPSPSGRRWPKGPDEGSDHPVPGPQSAGHGAGWPVPEGEGLFRRAVPIGDDCAAIPDGDGYLLLATEGFLNDFVATQPWFAGYCAVMVNLSDIHAMGGRPIAVVDALWSDGEAHAGPILEGMAAASRIYGVPIVGGHSNLRCDRSQLAASVLGRANRLLSSFAALPGQTLLAAIDLRGQFREPYSWWDASTGAEPQRLRDDLELLPRLAEAGLCEAAKDISMAGVIGTTLMLLECSGLGAVVDVTAVPRPEGVPLERWLGGFPSYGFVLSVAADRAEAVIEHFREREIACAAIGKTDDSRRLRLADNTGAEALLWDLNIEPLMGCGPATGA